MRRGRISRLAYQEKSANLEPLNGIEVRLDLKLWKNNDLIPSVGSSMTDYNFCHVILATRLSHRISTGLLKRRYLQHVGYHIPVGDHDAFLFALNQQILHYYSERYVRADPRYHSNSKGMQSSLHRHLFAIQTSPTEEACLHLEWADPRSWILVEKPDHR